MRRTLLIPILALTTLFAPPAASAPTPQRDAKKTITVGKLQREYYLHKPTNYDGSTALPLVLVLHGYGQHADKMVDMTKFDDKADTEGFFVAYLEGSGDGPGWHSGLIDDASIENSDDVAFVEAVIASLSKSYKIDAKRIYAAGFSNGAFMAHRLATELPDVLAAVASVEGTIGVSMDKGATFGTLPRTTGPIAVLMINGKQDTTVQYDGGGEGMLYVKPVTDAVKRWTTANGCTSKPVRTSLPNQNTMDSYSCASAREVALITLPLGQHSWPTTNNGAKLDGTDAVWDFFAKQKLTLTISKPAAK